jgi:hypothetical protein
LGSLVSATPKPGWLEYIETAFGVRREGLVGRYPVLGTRPPLRISEGKIGRFEAA